MDSNSVFSTLNSALNLERTSSDIPNFGRVFICRIFPTIVLRHSFGIIFSTVAFTLVGRARAFQRVLDLMTAELSALLTS